MLAAFSLWNLTRLLPNELCAWGGGRGRLSQCSPSTQTHTFQGLLVWKAGKGEQGEQGRAVNPYSGLAWGHRRALSDWFKNKKNYNLQKFGMFAG